MTEVIRGYAFNNRPVIAYPNLFDVASKKVIPLSEANRGEGTDRIEMHEVLDTITLAIEAGVVPRDSWVKFLFGTKERFAMFLEELDAYGDVFRLTDRWWAALEAIVDCGGDEAGHITFEDFAERLREAAEESGQL
jgi:hypothetical protein